MNNILIEKFKQLSQAAQLQIEKEVDKLLAEENNTTAKPHPTFGGLKGFVTYIADDFDAPLEEFNDHQ